MSSAPDTTPGAGIQVTTLANGLRVVTDPMPHLETAALGVWVATGARHEAASEHGICHLLEHMAFKGTPTRSARAIVEEIEQVGGDLNAATSLETTAYYARVLKADVGLGLEILADIVQRPTFQAEELAREKEVILQEIASIEDNPEEVVYDLAQEAAFPDQAAGRPIIGTPASVACHSSGDLSHFLARNYCGGGVVVSAAGAVDHAAFVRHAEALFGDLSPGNGTPGQAAQFAGGAQGSRRTFEQSHLVIAFEGPSYRAGDFIAMQVFAGLMGGGMSSRLFQEVRENRGLCYSVYASAWGLSDSGMVSIYAATGHEMVDELSRVVADEMHRAAETAAPEREVTRAKAQIKAGLLMGLESASARSEHRARQLLNHDRIITAEELIARIDAVSAEDIREIAARLLTSQRTAASLVGPGQKSTKIAGDIRRRFML